MEARKNEKKRKEKERSHQGQPKTSSANGGNVARDKKA